MSTETITAEQITDDMSVLFPGRVHPVTVIGNAIPTRDGSHLMFACTSRQGHSVVALASGAVALRVIA